MEAALEPSSRMRMERISSMIFALRALCWVVFPQAAGSISPSFAKPSGWNFGPAKMGCFGSKAEPAKPEPGSVAFGPSARAGVATGVDEVRSTPTEKPQPYHPPPSAPPALSGLGPQPTSGEQARKQEEETLVADPPGAPPRFAWF